MTVPERTDPGNDLPLPWDDTPQELYDHAPCGYLSTLPDGTVVNVNQTFLDWTGYGRADLVGRKRLRDLLAVGSLIYHETHVAPLLRMQGEIREIALDIRCASGRRMPTLVNATLSRDDDSVERLIRVTVFDATERRRYESELLQARRAAEESERRVRVLQQVVADLAAVPTASGVARAVVAAAGPAFGAADGGLWVVDADRRQLVLAAVAADSGWADAPLTSAGAVAAVIRRGEPLVLDSAARLRAELPQWADALHRRGRQGALLVPLTAHDAVLGVLACAFTEPPAIAEGELALARLLGQQAGQALDRARLYDEARLREERAVFLAEVSRALDEIPDLRPRAQRLVELIVPDVAGHAAIRLTGTPEVLAEAEAGGGPGDGASVVLPLTVRGAESGTLTVRPYAGRPSVDDGFLADLADRAGLALENARLYEREREVARTLQRSLLAGDLPRDLRFAVETHYRPAADGLEVGGDWYDAFLITPDLLAVVVGDVVGRGLHAASTMGQLRSAVRALAAAEAGPAHLVEQLDRFVDRHEPARMATLAYAEIRLGTGELVYCCAGHMPPLLLPAGGEPEFLWGGRSAPLGSRAGRTTRAEATLRLSEGDRLLLYTDGLVERRDRPLDDGLDRLAEAFATRRRAPLRGLAGSVADALVDNGQPDDVCLLCVSLGAEPLLERTIPANPHRIAALRAELRGWLAIRGVDEEGRDALMLACSEAVANAIEHAYRDVAHGVVTVTAAVADDAIVLRVRDQGSWREPHADDPARGRGLVIIGELTDGMEIERDGGTTVTMRRRIAP